MMVAVENVTAAGPLGRPVGIEDELKPRIAHLLSRSLAGEGIGDDQLDSLYEVLSDWPGPAAPGRKIDALLGRWGLPVPRRRPTPIIHRLVSADELRFTALCQQTTDAHRGVEQ